MAKKDRLKNGLDLLFEDNFHEEEIDDEDYASQMMRISLIEPDKDQPRKDFNEESLKMFAENISQHGVLQPILVTPIENGGYKIVAGERRWRAARIAGLSEIPVVVRDLSVAQAAQIALIENIQREDLNPIEEAKAYDRLIEEFDMTHDEIAKKVGKSRAAISNLLRLLSLSPSVQAMIESKQVTLGHAKVLCGLTDPEEQYFYALRCVTNRLTVRDLERQIKESAKTKKHEKDKKERNEKLLSLGDPFATYTFNAEQAFNLAYGVEARISKDGKGVYHLNFEFNKESELKSFVTELTNRLEGE